MKLSELTKYVGRQVLYRPPTGGQAVDDFAVAVTVVDAKSVYGHPKVAITPVKGSGQRWVNLSTLRFPEETGT